MRRNQWLLVAVPALFAVALAGCYQQPGPSAEMYQPPSASAATPADATPAAAAPSIDVPEGMTAVVLSVPGMS